ncbi:E3 ubiquitin-protein ligase parkin-like, partial [Anoplopoma fimbria]|uniref:E3 ubiquitin-protein ligase parkin-like n=1 Tax=Anoplopoma fimbria TaxID=229290 RepID=UPI0023EDE95C
MLVFVRYNLGPGVPVELQEEARVEQLKELVGSQQGVRPELLRVLFAGRELRSSFTLQGCDLPEQSTIHVLLPKSGSSPSQLLLLQERLIRGGEDEQNALTRLDLSSSHLPSTSSGLAVILEGSDGGGEKGAGGGDRGAEEVTEEVQAASLKGVRTCSTFFVYCKSCRSIQPGKLRRVRPVGTTSSSPVASMACVNQTVVTATCVCVQEFYMKCASHPTSEDEISVALDLIMTNSRDVPCIACSDIMAVVLVFQCSERHVICLDCFHGYCRTRLNERQFVSHPVIGYSLPCAAGCVDSLIKESHHFRIFRRRS